MTEKPLTELLRKYVKEEFCCPTCGVPRHFREVADKIGVNHTTLWRFMRGGKPSANLLDALYARYRAVINPRPKR